MLFFLSSAMLWLLVRPQTAIPAARDAAALFAGSVLPGLFPYMVLSLMLISRLKRPMPPWLVVLVGWCGGSPTGARLLRECPGMPAYTQRRIAVMTATMSPMFLVGTVGEWLASPRAGVCAMLAVILGGWLTGLMLPKAAVERLPPAPAQPLSFGQAVQSAAQTMLMVCGTMVMLRVFADLAAEILPHLLLTTVLEVTTGVQHIARLPVPLPLRTAMISAACGFGGMAILMQNRTALPEGLQSFPQQILWQGIHAGLSFLLALGLMLL